MQRVFTVARAARVLGLTRERIYQLNNEGHLEVIRGELGRRQTQKLITYDALLRYIDALTNKANKARARLHLAANGELD